MSSTAFSSIHMTEPMVGPDMYNQLGIYDEDPQETELSGFASSSGGYVALENLRNQLNVEKARCDQLLIQIAKHEDDKKVWKEQQQIVGELMNSFGVSARQLEALITALLGFTSHMCFGKNSHERETRQRIALDFLYPLIRLDSRLEELYTQVYYDKGPPYPSDPDYPTRTNEPLVQPVGTILRPGAGERPIPSPYSEKHISPDRSPLPRPQAYVANTPVSPGDKITPGVGGVLASGFAKSQNQHGGGIETGGRSAANVLALSDVPLEGIRIGVTAAKLVAKKSVSANPDPLRTAGQKVRIAARFDHEETQNRTLPSRYTQPALLEPTNAPASAPPEFKHAYSQASFSDTITLAPLPPKRKGVMPGIIIEVVNVNTGHVLGATRISFADLRTLKPTFTVTFSKQLGPDGLPPLSRPTNPTPVDETITLVFAPLPAAASLPACVIAHRKGLVGELMATHLTSQTQARNAALNNLPTTPAQPLYDQPYRPVSAPGGTSPPPRPPTQPARTVNSPPPAPPAVRSGGLKAAPNESSSPMPRKGDPVPQSKRSVKIMVEDEGEELQGGKSRVGDVMAKMNAMKDRK